MVADAPRVGRVVAGRYRVEEACEQGAAPAAVRAVRLVDGVEVLLFMAPSSTVAPGGVQRFAEMARPVRGLAQTRWMMVLDEGVDGDGSAYLVTSYWQRETAEQRVLRQGGINTGVAADLVLDLLEALGALHDRALAHRGLTTEDLLLVMGEDGALHGHVLAGGMLRALACGARPDDAILRTACTAPEQRRGELGGAESDVWAVGVVLYRMLTGSLPFPGETAAEVALSAATQDARPLDARFPEVLQPILDRALNKRAEGRYPDAHAMRAELLSALVEAGVREAPSAPTPPAHRPPAGTDDDDAGDLDALIASAKIPSTRPSAPPVSVAPPRAPLSIGPPRSAPPPARSLPPTSVAPAAGAVASFDLDADASGPAAPVEIPRAAPVPDIPVAPSVPAPSFATQESVARVSQTRAPRPDAPRPVKRTGGIGAGAALLVVLAATGGVGYLSRDFLRRTFSPPRPGLGDLDLPAEVSARSDAAVALTPPDATPGDASEPEPSQGPFQPRVETQAPAEFGEQLRVALPAGLTALQRHQFVTHVSAAPSMQSATVGGFTSCVDGRMFLHPGGVNGVLREAEVSPRCEGVDVALTEDLDGDEKPDAIAVDARRAALIVVGSERMRVERTLPLPNAWSVVAGLRFESGRRSEPAAVVFVSGEGVVPALNAVGLRSGRVYWRSDPSLGVGAPGDYGLNVTGDLDGDGAHDVLVGLLREGRRCVTALSGATGVALWRVPRCSGELGAQYLSAGPDLNDDHRPDLALGSALGRRITMLSGHDGAELVSAPPATEQAGASMGPGLLMTPDLARDGFPDVVVPVSEGNASSVLVYSANDGHRQATIPVSFDGAPVPISQIRLQYVENFAFSGSRSLLVATPGAVVIYGAAPRS